MLDARTVINGGIAVCSDSCDDSLGSVVRDGELARGNQRERSHLPEWQLMWGGDSRKRDERSQPRQSGGLGEGMDRRNATNEANLEARNSCLERPKMDPIRTLGCMELSA
jgi:hypothetical protein